MCCINSTGVQLIQDVLVDTLYITSIHIYHTYLLQISIVHNCYIVRRIDLYKLSYRSSTNAESFDLIHLSMAHQMSAQGRVAFVVVMYSRGYVSKFTV